MTRATSLLAALTLFAACGGDPIALPCKVEEETCEPLPDESCPETVVEGQACSLPPERSCINLGDVCGAGWGEWSLQRCVCVDGAFQCTGVGQQECAEGLIPDGTGCSMEGTGSCDTEPAGGSCSCNGGSWTCTSACPSFCPADAPEIGDGGPCDDEGAACRYGSPAATSCTCNDGRLACEAMW